ncbi:hypothetical protein RHS03_09809, partial [Rhizoctonia solani]
MELVLHYMETFAPSSASSSSCASKLEDLRNWQDAWSKFNLESPIKEVYDIHDAAFLDVRDGVFIKGFTSNPEFQLNSLLVVPLESDSHPSTLHFDFNFRTAVVDPSQELVVLVEFDSGSPARAYIHLVSSVTGKPHPLSSSSCFEINYEKVILKMRMPYIAIIAEILTVAFWEVRRGTRHYKVFIWNWRTGDLLYTIYSDKSRIYGLSFLSCDYLAILGAVGESGGDLLHLLIYDVRSNFHDHGRMPHQDPTAPSSKLINPVMQLNFPRLQEFWLLCQTIQRLGFMTQAECFPGRLTKIGSSVFGYSQTPILGIKLSLLEPMGNNEFKIHLFRIFISVDQLLQRIQSQRENQGCIASWHEWGTTATRWFVDNCECGQIDSFSLIGISGPRYVHCIGDDDDGLITVVDFDSPSMRNGCKQPLRIEDDVRSSVRRGYSFSPQVARPDQTPTPSVLYSNNPCHSSNHINPDSSDSTYTLIVGSDVPTVLGELNGFSEPVESRLSYRITARQPVRPGKFGIVGSHGIFGLQCYSHNLALDRDDYENGIYDEQRDITTGAGSCQGGCSSGGTPHWGATKVAPPSELG